ncbi:MAG: hypothetical protein ACI959_000370 [Limisphaerales bacterium]|jgi:hypothetical protein
MIISDKNKYVFVQLPKTASTAIEEELLNHYDGKAIMLKHDLYYKFLKQANAEQKKYFVFASVRNPMDIAASHYYNLLQENRLSKRTPKKHSLARRLWGTYRTKKRFDFIRDGEGDFKSYFLQFYSYPYANWSVVDHDKLDFVIRYEHMQDDFSTLLGKLGLEQAQPIPSANKTKNKKGHFLDLYSDPEVRQRAVNVFSPYFRQFGYEFPKEWGDIREKGFKGSLYPLMNVFRTFYWKYLR